jgi:ATP-binding cassette subfamily B protein
MSVNGVTSEERSDYTRVENSRLRQRSIALFVSLATPFSWRIALSGLLVVLATLASVAGPALLAIGIDQALPALTNDRNWIPTLLVVGGYIGAGLFGGIFMSTYIRTSTLISQGILLALRLRVFRHTQRLSMSFHETYTSGKIIARQTSDLDTLREFLDSGVEKLVSGVLYMAFTAIALIALDPPSMLPVVISFVPVFFFAWWFSTSSKHAFRVSRVYSARLIVQFVETMTGIRAVKAFRREEHNERTYGEQVDNYRYANQKVIQIFGIFDPGLKLVANIVMAIVLLLGALRVLDGGMEVGVLLAAVLYVRRIYDPVNDLAMFYNSLQSAGSALEKISGVLEEEPRVAEPQKPTPLERARGSLDLTAVSFSYVAGRPVLPDLDLHIPAGQTVALVGTTGAGKSTLAKLIARFYDPDAGSVCLDGIDLRNLSNHDLRGSVVMVTQEAYLFSGSVRENLSLGKPDATLNDIESAARAVGAHDFIMSLPDGYDTDVNKRGGRLSSGQRQLLSFARAFLADPTVLILDEATASLDIPSERLVQRGLQTLLADRTAIIIAHRLSTVSIADRVVVMEHGRVIEDGAPADLIAGTGTFANLHQAWRESLG